MRPRGRGVVLVVIVAMLTPALADADDLGGVVSETITVDSTGDLPVVPTIIMADCFCTTPWPSINGYLPEDVGSQGWRTAGIWSIAGAQLRPPTNATANRLALYDTGKVDVAVEADMFRVNKNVPLGIVVRSNGVLATGATMTRLQVTVSAGRALLTAVVAGVATNLVAADASMLPNDYRLRVEMFGSSVRVAAGGVVLIDTTLPAPFDTDLSAGTHVGLVSQSAGNERIDDVMSTTWPP